MSPPIREPVPGREVEGTHSGMGRKETGKGGVETLLRGVTGNWLSQRVPLFSGSFPSGRTNLQEGEAN